jgi:hypothetical protein
VILLALAAAAAFGYLLGRLRPGPRLLSWAEDAAAPGWRTWKFWPAAPIILASLAFMWTVHPRRTLANVRSWRDDQHAQRSPALTFNRTDRSAP